MMVVVDGFTVKASTFEQSTRVHFPVGRSIVTTLKCISKAQADPFPPKMQENCLRVGKIQHPTMDVHPISLA
jgi:hypothetical protein